jgi:predicted metal-dependent phosphoesterase TrpH
VTVDLHVHSTASDGTDDPADVVRRAARLGLGTIALTDHDTLAGIAEARQSAATEGIDLISGTELSVDWPTGKMHLLVYFLEPTPGPLQDRLEWLRGGRQERNAAIVERLQELGFEIGLPEVEAQAAGPTIGRPHIADSLVARGYFETRSEAFVDLLRDGGQAYVERRRLSAAEAIALSRESDAVPVIAHPYTIGLGRDEYAAAFRELAALGLGGIESYYPEHSPALRDHLARIAESLGIVATGGSDYHGWGKPEIELGVGRGDLSVPGHVVAALRSARHT